MCELCVGRMPPSETFDVCKGCVDLAKEWRVLFNEIRTTFPQTRTMTRIDIVKRLFEYRKAGR